MCDKKCADHKDVAGFAYGSEHEGKQHVVIAFKSSVNIGLLTMLHKGFGADVNFDADRKKAYVSIISDDPNVLEKVKEICDMNQSWILSQENMVFAEFKRAVAEDKMVAVF